MIQMIDADNSHLIFDLSIFKWKLGVQSFWLHFVDVMCSYLSVKYKLYKKINVNTLVYIFILQGKMLPIKLVIQISYVVINYKLVMMANILANYKVINKAKKINIFLVYWLKYVLICENTSFETSITEEVFSMINIIIKVLSINKRNESCKKIYT